MEQGDDDDNEDDFDDDDNDDDDNDDDGLFKELTISDVKHRAQRHVGIHQELVKLVNAKDAVGAGHNGVDDDDDNDHDDDHNDDNDDDDDDDDDSDFEDHRSRKIHATDASAAAGVMKMVHTSTVEELGHLGGRESEIMIAVDERNRSTVEQRRRVGYSIDMSINLGNSSH